MKIELNTLGSIGLILLSTKFTLRFRKVTQLKKNSPVSSGLNRLPSPDWLRVTRH